MTIPTMVSIIDKAFPQMIEQIDTASCSITKGERLFATMWLAIDRGNQHQQGTIRLVAAYDPDPDLENKYRTYVGLDEHDDVWLFGVEHGEHWNDDEKKGHPNHNEAGLCYEMKYMWAPIEGRMGDDFEEAINDIVGVLIGGKKYQNESVENAGCYPGMR